MKTLLATLDSRALTRLGMIFLLLFFVLSFSLRHWASGSWVDLLDGTSGLALGAAIAFLLLVPLARRRHRRGLEAGPCA